VECADFDGKYTELHWEQEISPNVITDRSTLINGDFTTKIALIFRLSYAKMEIATWRYRNEINLPSAIFPGKNLRNSFYTLYH